MKRFKALIIIGGIFLVIGLIVALGAPTNASSDSTFTVQSGAGYYYYYTLNGMFTGEQLTFTYALQAGGGTVDVYVLNSAEYSTYSYDLSVPSSLYANPTSTSGSGNVMIPAGGTYYLVVNHGSGSTGSLQTGSMSIQASGLNVTVLVIGLVFAVVGIVLLVLGYRMRSKEQRVPPGYAPPSQVTMFPTAGTGLPPPPQQPPQGPPPPTGPPPR